MDAIEYLTEHHRHIEDLFDKLDVVDDEDDKAEGFAHLARALALHDLIEQQHFYPLLKEKNLTALADEGMQAHEKLEQCVAELIDLDIGDEQFDSKLEQLRQLVGGHLRSEESVMFVQLKQVVDGDTLEALADEMQATVEALPDSNARELVAPDTVPPAP
jgi:hemerythrin superfamily protein